MTALYELPSIYRVHTDRCGRRREFYPRIVAHVHCVDCGIDLLPGTEPGSADRQYYMVLDDVWAAAGMRPDGGQLCIGCLEVRLGRRLTGADFPDYPINWPGHDDDTARLAWLKSTRVSVGTEAR